MELEAGREDFGSETGSETVHSRQLIISNVICLQIKSRGSNAAC